VVQLQGISDVLADYFHNCGDLPVRAEKPDSKRGYYGEVNAVIIK
jgi:hypothetical protein